MTDDAWFGVTPEPVAKYVPEAFSSRITSNAQQSSCR